MGLKIRLKDFPLMADHSVGQIARSARTTHQADRIRMEVLVALPTHLPGWPDSLDSLSLGLFELESLGSPEVHQARFARVRAARIGLARF